MEETSINYQMGGSSYYWCTGNCHAQISPNKQKYRTKMLKQRQSLEAIRMLKLAILLILAFCLGTHPISVVAQPVLEKPQVQTFQIAQISIENQTVDAVTELTFHFMMRRAAPGDEQTYIEKYDYMLLEIPIFETTAEWYMDEPPRCELTDAPEPMSCVIVSKKQAKITFEGFDNLMVHGTITGFKNPHSVGPLENIQASVWNRRGDLKILASSLSLQSFSPTYMEAHLKTSSERVGDQHVQLMITIDPWSRMQPKGQLHMELPEYYEGASNDFMFDTTEPEPCLLNVGVARDCEFSRRENILRINYEFENGKERSGEVKFIVGGFNNPVKKVQGGFFFMLLDENEREMAETANDVFIEGITEPAQFKFYDFNYVDFPHSAVYAVHQFSLISSIPIQQGCWIRIVYPDDMLVDDKLVEIQGVGFAAPTGGKESLDFRFTGLNTIEFRACEENYGLFTTGTITLSRVKNQKFKHTLEDFKVYMTQIDDPNFESPYQQVIDKFQVKADQQKGGKMEGQMTFTSTLIQTKFDITFDLTTSQVLSSRTFIMIDFPRSITIRQQEVCFLKDVIGFSDRVVCQRRGRRMVIGQLFDETVTQAGTQIKFTIENFIMPTSVQNLGHFLVRFIDTREAKLREIDVFEDHSKESTPGDLVKAGEVEVASSTTSLTSQTYIFTFQMYHRVPRDGMFSILLSTDHKNGVRVTDPHEVHTSCDRIMPDGSILGLECISGFTEFDRQPYVNITCTRATFGDEGTANNEIVQFRIGGLTNPRIQNRESLFKIQTMDEEYRYIDISPSTEKFFVQMENLIEMTDVFAFIDNPVNGGQSNLTIRIVPSTRIYSGDIITMDFPKQLGLPENIICDIGEPDINPISRLSCTRIGELGMKFEIQEISNEHKGGLAIEFVVRNLTNPQSTRPTDSFTNIILIDGETGGNLAQYTQDVRVQTTEMTQLSPYKANIRQSSYKQQEDSIVEISFETNQHLNANAAIVVDVPKTIMKVYGDTSECRMYIRDFRMESLEEQPTLNCKVVEHQVIFSNAFTKYTGNDFEGNIHLFFKTQNPIDSQNLTLTTIPYQISIWDSDDLTYGIDLLDGILYPSITCAYPCNTCSDDNPHECLSCLPQETAPQYIHTPLFVEDANQTCVDICPFKQGYTPNGSQNPKRCVKCADTCQECAINNQEGDVDICTVCKQEFPYMWVNHSSCHAEGCPNESYLQNPYTCHSCEDKCLWCSDRLTCTKCDIKTRNAFFFTDSCVTECPYAYTPVKYVCTPCEDPCQTCALGLPSMCLTCDNTGGNRQFFYNQQCLEECPINTTHALEDRICLPCLDGCAHCDRNELNRCIRCHEGLLLHENQCINECPFDYLPAKDGSVCELRTYFLDELFIPVPFIGGAVFFCFIILISYWLTKRKTLVATSMIAFFGPIEMGAAAYQLYYALQERNLFWPIIYGNAGSLLGGLVVNLWFLVSYHKQIKVQDRSFARWRKRKWIISNFLLALSCVTSLTIYRLSYSRLFNLDIFNVRLNRPRVFIRPIIIFTWIKVAIFNFPLSIINIIGIDTLSWGNQCHMAMVESLTISLFGVALLIWETLRSNYLIESELEVVKDETDEETSGKDAFEYKGLGKVVPGSIKYKEMNKKGRKKRQAVSLKQIMFQLQNHVSKFEIKEAELREKPTPRTLTRRIEQMTEVLDHIRKQRDLMLNDTFDTLLDMEVETNTKGIRRSRSIDCIHSLTHNDLADDVSEVPTVDSHPGWGIDVDEKRRLFEEYAAELIRQRDAGNEKGNQWEEQNLTNIYAEGREPPPAKSFHDRRIQTLQEKRAKNLEDAERMAQQKRDMVLAATLLKRERDEEYVRNRKKQVKRRGKKFYYINPIDSEDDPDTEDSDANAQEAVPLAFDEQKLEMIQDVMVIEKDQSLTTYYELQLQEQEEANLVAGQSQTGSPAKAESEARLQSPTLIKPKGLDLSRISGDLDISDEDDYNQKLLDQDEEAKRLHEVVKIDNINTWLKGQSDAVNQRNFNENDIMGNFERDWAGKIINHEQTLRELKYKDLDGYAVNKQGYLIDEVTGDLRSKYTFDVIFKKEELIGTDDKNKYELPLPYRMERNNFNPHECFGNFEYEDDDKPMILQDAHGRRMDRNWRSVNASGWLIDEHENIVDNKGYIKFVTSQLENKGQIPRLYTYDGREYKILDIIGIFERDIYTKEILLGPQEDNHDPNNPVKKKKNQSMQFKSQDLRGRRVNSKGYLLDSLGNIINKKGQIIWRSHELIYNEPPKIFSFTEFSPYWIKGLLDHDMSAHAKKVHNHAYDLQGRPINSLGYLIDENDNILDCWNGCILFRKVLLEEYHGQESQIPYIFRSGRLRQPLDEVELHLQDQHDRALRGKFGHTAHAPEPESDDDTSHINIIEKRHTLMFGKMGGLKTGPGALERIDSLSIAEASQDLEISSRRQEKDLQFEGEAQEIQKVSTIKKIAKGRKKEAPQDGPVSSSFDFQLKQDRGTSSQLRGRKAKKASFGEQLGAAQDGGRTQSALRGSQQFPLKDSIPHIKRIQFMLDDDQMK